MVGIEAALNRIFLPKILWACSNSGSGVQVLQNKNLQDLVQVLNGGTVQVLLVVIKSVPNGGERGGDEVEDVDTWQRQAKTGDQNKQLNTIPSLR